MANIFGGVEVPAWLTELTRQRPGQLGHTIGLALGGGMLALQPNEDGDGLKGIQQGLYEARLNEQDPNWQVKTEALKSQVVGNWARAATEWQSLNTMKQDMADWMNHDLGALTKYSEELKTNPDATPPVVQSTKGHQALQQIETSRLRQSTLDVKRQMAKDLADYHEGQLENASTAAKQKLEDMKYFNKILPTVKSPAERARIRELQEKGNTADAMAALEAAEKEKPVSVQAAEARTEGKLKEIDATETQKRNLEADRQKNRIEVKMLDIMGRKQLEQIKEDAKSAGIGPNGQSPEDYYVNRHMNSVLSLLRDQNKYLPTEKQKSAHDMEADADISLRAMFRASRPNAPKAQPKTTSPFKETQAAPAPSTNAPTTGAAPAGKVLKYDPATDSLQ